MSGSPAENAAHRREADAANHSLIRITSPRRAVVASGVREEQADPGEGDP